MSNYARVTIACILRRQARGRLVLVTISIVRSVHCSEGAVRFSYVPHRCATHTFDYISCRCVLTANMEAKWLCMYVIQFDYYGYIENCKISKHVTELLQRSPRARSTWKKKHKEEREEQKGGQQRGVGRQRGSSAFASEKIPLSSSKLTTLRSRL